jgi:hypothetical protein
MPSLHSGLRLHFPVQFLSVAGFTPFDSGTGHFVYRQSIILSYIRLGIPWYVRHWYASTTVYDARSGTRGDKQVLLVSLFPSCDSGLYFNFIFTFVSHKLMPSLRRGTTHPVHVHPEQCNVPGVTLFDSGTGHIFYGYFVPTIRQ